MISRLFLIGLPFLHCAASVGSFVFADSSSTAKFTIYKPAGATVIRNSSNNNHHRHRIGQNTKSLWELRGGNQHEPEGEFESPEVVPDTASPTTSQEETTTTTTLQKSSMISTALVSFGQLYSKSLDTNPIATKSVTAACIFAVSDWLAQTIERSGSAEEDQKKHDTKRTVAASLVGFCYFGPASHYW
jgi:hypothetical protein